MHTRLTDSTERRAHGFLLALPAIFWLGIFFLLPLLIVLGVSFLSRGSGGIPAVLPFTLQNYTYVLDTYNEVIVRSVWIALITTLICLLVGYPLAFFIRTRERDWVKQFALFLVILPFWTNFLVRTYSWRTILGPEGIINSALLDIGLLTEPLPMLNNQFAVIIGMVYAYIPFMTLPIYATVSKFDFRFLEAAHDLGANDWSAFWRVILPMTLPGVIAGCILVFIPSVGTFVISDLLGGPQDQMIGNWINTLYQGSGAHLPRGAALSIIMMLLLMFALLIYVFFGEKEGKR
ncbi:MAG: ABC transporter permease [Anaerolineae bacterium]|jgi:spermidine/putrescine transport system permease protein|nr:ABC transporter permease [Anaerolineae bacterium]